MIRLTKLVYTQPQQDGEQNGYHKLSITSGRQTEHRGGLVNEPVEYAIDGEPVDVETFRDALAMLGLPSGLP
jgi:hypothetical protein